MNDTATRLPAGLRTLSDRSLLEVRAALTEVKHTKLVEALLSIVVPESFRRSYPAEIEPEWPSLDVTAWSIDELFRALRDCLALASVLTEPEGRRLAHNFGCICWSEFRHRVGAEALPFDENPNT